MHDFGNDGEAEPMMGDDAGEHLYMPRGEYSGWPYVVIAVLLQALVPFVFVAALDLVDPSVEKVAFALAALSGAGLVFAAFWNRWRVIEAFASRFCVGWVNISVFIAVPAALLYANARLALRLARREAWLVAASVPRTRPSWQ